jgi:hypothetical protein
MTQIDNPTDTLAWPSLRHARGRLLGLPFVLTAAAAGIAYGPTACAAALLIASMANFLVYLPLTVLTLNGGAALHEDAPAPPLTPRAYVVLFLLWTVTVWVAAALTPHLS